MEIINISQTEWSVRGYWPWVPLLKNSMELGQELMGVTDWIPATVPGGVHYDLFRAGLIEHPYYEMNSLHCEWVENRWWVYRTSFKRPSEAGSLIELVCKGLDYEASIYVNNKHLGDHEGMYHQAIFDITEICREHETLHLQILLKHAPDEMGQIGLTSKTYTQKSRFGYKWDFSTRLVNLGLWDDVELRVHQAYSLANAFLVSDVEGNRGVVRGTVDIQNNEHADNKERLRLVCSLLEPDGREYTHEDTLLQAGGGAFSFKFLIDQPALWNPNGYGEQPLYTLNMRLYLSGQLLDERVLKTGIRKLEYLKNEGSHEDALPYTVQINGRKIYIKGVNITPLDHLYGNVLPGQYEWMVHLMKKSNVNLVRVWGGGIIEKEILYRLCDEHGILVWQDFIQSSSGVDNVPSKLPQFLKLLEIASTEAIKQKRNHVSLTFWCGGNELMNDTNKPSTIEDENVSLLMKLVQTYDTQRLFLPTTASGPVEYITREQGKGHDVHGHWQYVGNPGHYEDYADNDCLFHSEFGVAGVSCVKSLEKFVDQRNLKPVSIADNLTWRHHGEWWDTLERDTYFFGAIPTIEQFSDCSQWIQAEGLRFILEANRRRKFQNSGSIIWQFNEPWPNVSCTNLVDYYGEQKMAYYWARNAYSPYHVSLDYLKLNFSSGELFKGKIYVHGMYGQSHAKVRLKILDLKGRVLSEQLYETEIPDNRSARVAEVNYTIPVDYKGMFLIRLELTGEQGHKLDCNDYFFTTEEAEVYRDALSLESKLQITQSSEPIHRSEEGLSQSVFESSYRIVNRGDAAALFVRPEEKTDGFWMTASDAYFSLMPGEEKVVSISCLKKHAGGLTLGYPDKEAPQIRFRSFLSE